MAGFKGGFGGGNMQAMMKQAQMMQQKLADAQKELEEIENMTPVPGENETSFRLRQSHWKSAIRALQYRLHDIT